MRVLVVKTSSMGDLIHALPALTDAHLARPEIRFDWVAERSFVEIPAWHEAVNRVIPISLRHWRKQLSKPYTWAELRLFAQDLRQDTYDVVIDLQGLLKSAWITALAQGESAGMDFSSCREPLASLFYKRRFHTLKQHHAIERIRQLMAQALDYDYDAAQIDYGLNRDHFTKWGDTFRYLVFLHATSGAYKLWPIESWRKLAIRAQQDGFSVYLPWGSEVERRQADAIAESNPNCMVLPRLNLTEMAGILAYADAVVGVDTGLAHLTAALNVPSVTLYTATYPGLTGACGCRQLCLTEQRLSSSVAITGLSVKSYQSIAPESVWSELQILMGVSYE